MLDDIISRICIKVSHILLLATALTVSMISLAQDINPRTLQFASPNLIKNANFENGTAFWKFEDGPVDSYFPPLAVSELVTPGRKSNTALYKISYFTADGVQDVAVDPESRYFIAAWVRVVPFENSRIDEAEMHCRIRLAGTFDLRSDQIEGSLSSPMGVVNKWVRIKAILKTRAKPSWQNLFGTGVIPEPAWDYPCEFDRIVMRKLK